MMWASEWQGMRNKQVTIMGLLLAIAASALAQESGSGAPSTAATEAAASVSPSKATESEVREAEQGAEDIAQEPVLATAESSPDNSDIVSDEYRPTERISEDRSVSFPVDI